MDRGGGGSLALKALLAMGLATACAPAAWAASPGLPHQPGSPLAMLHLAAGSGIDIVRMPQRSASNNPVPSIPVSPQTPAAPPRAGAPAQPQGRLLKLQARIAGQPNDPQKGWLGVEMESLELPLALSLGLASGDGA